MAGLVPALRWSRKFFELILRIYLFLPKDLIGTFLFLKKKICFLLIGTPGSFSLNLFFSNFVHEYNVLGHAPPPLHHLISFSSSSRNLSIFPFHLHVFPTFLNSPLSPIHDAYILEHGPPTINKPLKKINSSSYPLQ